MTTTFVKSISRIINLKNEQFFVKSSRMYVWKYYVQLFREIDFAKKVHFFQVAEIFMLEPRVEVTIVKMALTSKLPFWAFWRHLL